MSLVQTMRTWLAGETLTAALLNAEVRDPLTDLQAEWDTYTPIWTASTNPSIGNGSLTGRYHQIGKTVHFLIRMTAGTTTTFGTGQFNLSLPATAQAASRARFLCDINDASAGTYVASAAMSSTTTVSLQCDPLTAGNPYRSVTSTVPFTWADGDSITITGTYEAA